MAQYRVWIIMLFFLAPFSAIMPAQSENQWVLKRDREGIKVFVRDILSQNIKECKALIFLPDTRLASLAALLDDAESYTKWMYNCQEAKVLKKINKYERISYASYALPFGLSDRDMVNYSVIEQDPDSKALIVRFSSEPDFIPRIPGRVRIREVRGQWHFRPEAGGVAVEYLFHMDPAGKIPGWMINVSLPDAPFQTLKGMRRMVAADKYRNADFSELRE